MTIMTQTNDSNPVFVRDDRESPEAIRAYYLGRDREQTLLDQRLAGIATPDGASADEWSSIRASDGDAVRSLTWARHDTDKVGVGVDGWQTEAGEVTRHIGVYDVPDELTADDARSFAAALVAAADTLDGLEK